MWLIAFAMPLSAAALAFPALVVVWLIAFTFSAFPALVVLRASFYAEALRGLAAGPVRGIASKTA